MPGPMPKAAKNYILALKAKNPELNIDQIWHKVNEDYDFLARIGRGAISETFVREVLDPSQRKKKLEKEGERKIILRNETAAEDTPEENTAGIAAKEDHIFTSAQVVAHYYNVVAPDERRNDLATYVVKADHFAKAIKKSISNIKVDDEDARDMAEHILHFFGFRDRIVDNILEKEDRDVFYILEDNGLLTSEREETTLFDGREWRIHYWILKKEKIREIGMEEKYIPKEISEERNAAEIYKEIPAENWRPKNNATPPTSVKTSDKPRPTTTQMSRPAPRKTGPELDTRRLRDLHESKNMEEFACRSALEAKIRNALRTYKTREDASAIIGPEFDKFDELRRSDPDTYFEFMTYDNLGLEVRLVATYESKTPASEEARGGLQKNTILIGTKRIPLGSATDERKIYNCIESIFKSEGMYSSINGLLSRTDIQPTKLIQALEYLKTCGAIKEFLNEKYLPHYAKVPTEARTSQTISPANDFRNLNAAITPALIKMTIEDRLYKIIDGLYKSTKFPLPMAAILTISGRELGAPTWQISEAIHSLKDKGELIEENGKYRPKNRPAEPQ